MWKLSARDNKIRQWAELGEFQSINDAARHILKLKGDPHDPRAALFLRVYVDPPFTQSDADILCRLEYQSEKGFYVWDDVNGEMSLFKFLEDHGNYLMC